MNRPGLNGGYVCLSLLIAAALAAGCGRETPSAAAQARIASSSQKKPVLATPVSSEAATADKKGDTATAEVKAPRPPARLLLNPFQMPDIPEEYLVPKDEPKPAEDAAPARPAERIQIRLLGFSDVDGFKALVELRGNVHAVSPGDFLEGVEVVSIEPPKVTFQSPSSRWATKLFDQPWYNQQTGLASTSGSSRTISRQTRPGASPGYNTSAAKSSPAVAPGVPGIPGMPGGNSLIPGMPTSGGPGGGIPGLGTLPGGGGSALPGIGAPGGAMPGGGPIPGGGIPGGGIPGGGAAPGVAIDE